MPRSMPEVWEPYPNDVFVCRDLGIVVKIGDSSWYAYPLGAGELGPFSNRAEATLSLRLHVAATARATPRAG
jgi:hypothetical protein